MEKRALGWDTTYDKGGKIFSTRYETEPFDGASKEKGGPDYRGRHTYSKTREVTPDDPYYKNAVKTLAKRRKKNRFVKEAEERRLSYLERSKGMMRAGNSASSLHLSPKVELFNGRLNSMKKPVLKGASIGAGVAGGIAALISRKAGIGALGALGGAIVGTGIGAATGLQKHDTKYFGNKGIDYGYLGFGSKFSREAAKKYITGMDKQAGKIKQAIRERKAEKKQYDGGRAPRRLRTPRTTAGVLLQLSRMQ